MSQQKNNNMQKNFYRASAADFGKIPGSPVAYWVSKKSFDIFYCNPDISALADARVGLQTSDNERFLRYWYEVNFQKIYLNAEGREDALKSSLKWFPCNKGGEFRKWYGNHFFVVNWEKDGEEIRSFRDDEGKLISRPQNMDFYFKEAVSWSDVSSSANAFRYFPKGFINDATGHSAFGGNLSWKFGLMAYCNNKYVNAMAKILNPTIHFHIGYFNKLPYAVSGWSDEVVSNVKTLISIGKTDWCSYEGAWDFINFPLFRSVSHEATIDSSYQNIRKQWFCSTLEMQRLEQENNRIFIEAYGLQDELTPEVPLSEITLTCNPHYRYGGNLTDKEREERLQSDTIAELISYAIGCMMGRYSLDREGLVYAHAGNEGFKALVEEGAYTTFPADGDGILPMTSDAWFEDDVATRAEQFVRTVWGAETLEENLAFIADSLCLSAIKPVKKGGETARETLRRYLSTQFFKDHMKTYKKRPIYWLFSSGKEKAFECLVYLHRYNEATLPRMRTEYVTPLLGQMAGRIDRLRLQQAEASTAEAKRLGKEIDSLTKQLTELRAFDDELKHHADMRITLDLDDGVKVNYGKFGTLLSDVKAITGDKGE
ncbi:MULTISPECIES: BREX-1 system adenine-specific DNA-methyltransferase PglX [Aeromonas]|uniref:BREX-1 system adenine-specific DNA-methyltransferase PglX n=1 Tax=Aeromonas TaxID=642 RepID=UPI001EEDF80B|nr:MULTISPECIES: BREX-1 system adenine-specific DNA-methyltransferase PglX [Aeromonas]